MESVRAITALDDVEPIDVNHLTYRL
ncbi:MAG: hypothetical protein QOC75_3371, partial [Pseudonocardiales bacterium]|nr:hypothetical protein [Pseudonocardiales bacterium]